MSDWEEEEGLNGRPCVEHNRRVLRHEVPLVTIILSQLMGHAYRQIAIHIT